MTKPAPLLLSFSILVVACGGAVASSEATPTGGPSSAAAPAPSDASRGAVASSSSSSSGGSSSSSSSSGGQKDACNLSPRLPTQTVTLHLTNTSSSVRWIATQGNQCSTIDIERAGTSVPQMPGFQCLCECPSPGEARVTQFTKLAPGESTDIPWLAQRLELCSQTYDCGQNGWPGGPMQTRWVSAVQPLSAGPVTARLAVESELPPSCHDDGGKASCDVSGGVTTPFSSPVAAFCGGTQTVSADFVVPASGDLTVDVAVP